MDRSLANNRSTSSLGSNISQNASSLEDVELSEMAKLAGIQLDSRVFKIILDLIRLNVTPDAIVHLLRTIVTLKTNKTQ